VKGKESRPGRPDDNDSIGSGGGKADWNGKTAWNVSQVEEDVKWQQAMGWNK